MAGCVDSRLRMLRMVVFFVSVVIASLIYILTLLDYDANLGPYSDDDTVRGKPHFGPT